MIPKQIMKIVSIFCRLVCALMLIVLLMPLSYFAWRASQPLERAEFQSLSYFDLMMQRQAAYARLAITYQASHPEVEVKDGMCFGVELFVEMAVSWPGSGFYTLAGAYPSLRRYVNPRDLRRGYVPENINLGNFLPTWWNTFELFLSSLIRHVPQGAVAYCRIAIP